MMMEAVAHDDDHGDVGFDDYDDDGHGDLVLLHDNDHGVLHDDDGHCNLVLHPGSESLIEPKVVPPFHRHQVAKPLRIVIITF